MDVILEWKNIHSSKWASTDPLVLLHTLKNIHYLNTDYYYYCKEATKYSMI